MKRVLFLCKENSCRSQMSEAITKKFLGDRVQAFSAGTKPTRVNPLAVRVLKEMGMDISSFRSKHVDEFKDMPFDLVVTLCGGARESCPLWEGQGKRLHFGLFDPSKVKGTEEDVIRAFKDVRDKMVEELIPVLKKELDLK